MNTIFFHRADPVTKGGGSEEQERITLVPWAAATWIPRVGIPETMAEFGTKATENAHAIRACKPVHVLSLRTSFQTWISFPFSRILLLVRVTIGGEREREKEIFRLFIITMVDQGRWSKGQEMEEYMRSGRRNDKKIKRIEWHTVGMRGTCTYTCNLSTWRLLSDGKLDQLSLSLSLFAWSRKTLISRLAGGYFYIYIYI